MAKLIFIFIDGVGIGKASNTNPFFVAKSDYFPFFENGCVLPDGTPIKPIDALLGIHGIPMSATGQTTLFTGINVPALLNEHRESYPDKIMRKVIKEKNIFSHLRSMKLKPRFINVFPGSSHIFSSHNIYLQDDGEFYFSPHFKAFFKRSISVTTCMMIANQMLPFSENDIRCEKALFHDFSNESLLDRYNLPRFSPEKASEILFNVSRNYDFLLYEYFLTDFIGHSCDLSESIMMISQLNRLVKQLVSLLNKETDTLLITSDHGNMEDTTNPLHTNNPVPLFVWGYKSNELRSQINSLADVKQSVIDFFTNCKTL
jgi:2,3-bisphosphoglycerate-independent phosphoglycerate mutase